MRPGGRPPFPAPSPGIPAPPYPLQNDGLREAEHPVPGFFLTADLCPAKKPLDRGFFEATTALPQKQPVPLALMVSGLWIQRHADDLAWLKDQAAAGKTSDHLGQPLLHPSLRPGRPAGEEFPPDARKPIYGRGALPGAPPARTGADPLPLFPFSRSRLEPAADRKLRDLSLIPIGSNAWLAKGETPQPGSIILVHANGNEPEGIRLLLSFYDKQHETFRRGMALLPLREAFLSR